MRFRAELRARWAGLFGVAVLVGLAGGFVLTAAAGARRTDSNLARVIRTERPGDVLVNPDVSDNGPAFNAAWAAVDRLPGVRAVARADGLGAAPLAANGQVDPNGIQGVLTMAAVDGGYGRDLDRPYMIAGRMPDPSRADEVYVNQIEAKRDNLHVGSRLRWGVVAMHDQSLKVRFVEDFIVVGIGRTLDEATRAADDPQLSPSMLFSRALNDRLSGATPPFTGKSVALTGGAKALPAFEAGVRDVFRNVTVVDDSGHRSRVNMNFQESGLTVARARRAVQPYVLALWLFAGLAALASLAVIAQALSRSMRPLREERDRLSAIGFSRRQFVQTAALRGLVVGAIGAAIALAVAYALSSLMPIGPLRAIDPARGRHVDAAVFALGCLSLLALAVLGTTLSLRRRRPPRSGRPVVADELARSGLPVPIVSGVRFALDRGRDTDVPLRSTLFGITIAIAALVATLVYGASLTRFTATPTRFGWPWSYMVTVDGGAPPPQLGAHLASVPGVRGVAPGVFSQFEIGGRSVAAVGIDETPGVGSVPILRGRAPVADDEIVLGENTMRALHAQIGGTVPVFAQTQRRTFRVVGEGVFARFAPYSGSEPTGLGVGAATTAHAIESMNAATGSHFFLVDVARRGNLDGARLLAAVDGGTPIGEVVGPQRPNDVLSYDHLSRTPLALAGALVLLALGSAIHLLVTGVRSRQRDVALLKTIGLTRGQARSAVLVQATVLVGIAMVVALPLGVLGGHWLWARTAQWLGIAHDVALPISELFLVMLVALVLANAVAWGPAMIAARIRPAVALRSE
jgi:hypothetical protein